MAAEPPESRRVAECPNCGAPIAWRLASSQATVCGYCRFSVVRSDRDLTTLGRVADLVPTAAPLAVGDQGSIAGRGFRVLGRVQRDHGRGPWDEFYVAFSDGGWGWLARAEGRWYLTFARPCSEVPAWEALTPDQRIVLDGTGSVAWVVVERGGSALISAEGELPFPIDPKASGRHVDLEGEGAAFATLDYGDGSTPPELYAGRALEPDELALKRMALGPRPEERVAVSRLTCPQCGAPVPIFVPSESERCGCAACGALLDHAHGALSLLAQLEPPAIRPLIPLGSVGTLLGEERTVIGFMQRHVRVDDELFTFREYLLYGKSGYAFLVEENHHWLLVAPIAASAVREADRSATYGDVRYRKFTRARPVVDFVIGEFYWKVARGDESETADFIAPPRVLSVERTESEVTWSAGEYVAPSVLAAAFGLKGLPRPTGVAPAQPNPFATRGLGYVLALLALLWAMLALAYEVRGGRVVTEIDVALPPHDAAQPASVTSFSSPFLVPRGPTTLEVGLASPIQNGWVQVEAALVPEAGGTPRELPVLLEHYQGTDGGESWEEGGTTAEGYFGSVAEGKYTLRFVSSWAPQASAALTPPALRVRVTEGARSPACCFGALLLIALPFFLAQLRRFAFEARRNAEESL